MREFYGDAIKLANGEVLKRGPTVDAELAGEDEVRNALAASDVTSQEDVAGQENTVEENGTADETENQSNGSQASNKTAETEQEEPADSDVINPDALANTESEVSATGASGPTTQSTSEQIEVPEEMASTETADNDSETEKFPTFRILETPVPLPAIEGFEPVLKVKTEPATEADLIVTFTVNANGKVDNLERVQVPESAGPRSPDRVLRRLRRLRFRPVFEAGEPVESEPITWVFGPEHWASPYDSVTETST